MGGAGGILLAGSPASPRSWQPIMKFINDQYEKYLQEEVNINRKKRIPDTRVHCCLYFIPATGHSYVLAWGRGGGALHAPRLALLSVYTARRPPRFSLRSGPAGTLRARCPALWALPGLRPGQRRVTLPHPCPCAPGSTLIHVVPSQPQAPGHRVHEAPKQSGQHRSGHRQGRHADPGGAGPLQTAGRAHSPRPPAPFSAGARPARGRPA